MVTFRLCNDTIQADVILMSSLDYRFVQVGGKGRVSHYAPRTTSGHQQHLVYIKPFTSRLVHMPIVATTKGRIKVTIVGRSQVGKDVKEIEMDVIADGAAVDMHTSLLLDMTSQAFLVKFLNINVTEDPVIPYIENFQRFVPGSPEATISLIGDVVGAPADVEEHLVDFTSLGISRAAKSGELLMFNFAYHLKSLWYLRLTDQLTSTEQREKAKQWLDVLNQDYVSQMSFFRGRNFYMFFTETGSVWLNAFCAKTYHEAIYSEWEHQLFIDPNIIKEAVLFILPHQQTDGHFIESLETVSRNLSKTHRYTPVALTAYVLITLNKVSSSLGSVGSPAANAKKAAINYLENQLPHLTAPFEIAITTYALLEVGTDSGRGSHQRHHCFPLVSASPNFFQLRLRPNH